MTQPYILVIDDEPDIRELVKEILDDEGYSVAIAENAEAARQARRARRPDLILLDIWMPDTDGISLLKEWADGDSDDAPVIMMSGHGTVETAVEATRLGAYDFLEKPLSIAKLLLTVRNALENAQLRQENIGLKRDVVSVTEPIGRGANMQALREQAKRIAQHETPVLITGESGSGKELFARFIHAQSNRRAGNFVRVAGSGLVGDAASVELFGAEEGSSIHYGALERANGGTLFLEDVADIDAALQGRLLSALGHASFVRTSGHEPVELNTRLIAATSRDLARLVETGKFREDLFYHLNVVPLQVPPLRDHREDIPELLEFYADNVVSQENLAYRRFTVAGQNRLRNYTWPGNIRELKNVVQRLFILGSGTEIDLQEIEIALGEAPRTEAAATFSDFSLPLKEARERFERAYLEHQIRLNGGSVSKVAKSAGMERTHLYRKLRALGIDSKRVARNE
jgi:two-component system nitrogen regulation response regulator NtrX